MITSSGLFKVETGGTTYYDTADVRIFINTQDETGNRVVIELRIFKNTTNGQIGQYFWASNATLINAETGTGTGQFLLTFTACQLAAKTYLSGLNPTVTFNIV